jgi:hypothetical protein
MIRYEKSIRRDIIGQKEGEDEPIIGDPIGVDALKAELAFEMIPYRPRSCSESPKRSSPGARPRCAAAARDMGLGDDWKAAVEKVKNTYVEPGKQIDLVRDLEKEAETVRRVAQPDHGATARQGSLADGNALRPSGRR